MPHATINGVDLFYDEQGEGEPLLIHHGYTGSHYNWDEVAPILARRWKVYRMDCRGAGDSARPSDGHTIEQYAADVAGMADHLGLGRFTYIGHSMGGVIGYELGLSYPGRLEKLVLVAPAPADGVVMPQSMRDRALRLRHARDLDTLTRESIALTARVSNEQAIAARVQRAQSVSDAHYDQSWDALVTYHKGDRLGEITTPTLVVAGAADSLLRANLLDFQRLPNATLHVFSRVSHGIPYEIPEEFAAVIADFLDHGVVTAETLRAKLLQATTV